MDRIGTAATFGRVRDVATANLSSRRMRALGAGLVVIGALGLIAPAPSWADPVCGPTGGGFTTCTFPYTDAEQQFVVPAGVSSINVLAIGGAGGNGFGVGSGGLGAKVTATLPVSGGQSLYVEVGGNGTNNDGFGNSAYAGGFNGGGTSKTQHVPGADGAGGGGASDVRTAPTSAGLMPDPRLIVAGGGGGGSAFALGGSGDAGAAQGDGAGDTSPGLCGGDADGGTATQGGAGGQGRSDDVGSLGQGGTGQLGGGGGGGLYGGGGGVGCGGGGAGSSFVSPAATSYAFLPAAAAAQVTISYQPPATDLSIGISGPATVLPSGAISYTLTVTNNGLNQSSGFAVSDSVPATITGVASTTPGCGVSANQVSCNEGPLAVGASFVMTVTGTAPNAAGVVTDTASVTGNELDPNAANESASVTTAVGYASVSLLESVLSGTPNVGSGDTFTLTASNGGPLDSGPVVVTDVVPSGLAYVSSSPSGGSVVLSGQTVTWTIPDLSPSGAGSTATLQIAVIDGTLHPLANTATFTQTTPNALGATTGNSNTVTVTAQDVPPVLVGVPANRMVTANALGGAKVTYAPPSATDVVDGSDPVSCLPASGSTFALGTTVVSCGATDSAGSTTQATFTVTVADVAPVLVGVPANQTVTATGAGGATVTYAPPRATDVVDGSDPVSCLPASGSTFALGTTAVTCTATDKAGDTTRATFTVTVQVTVGALCTLTATDVEGSNNFKHLNSAQQAVVVALANAACKALAPLSGHLTASQTAAAIAAYDTAVNALAGGGWLTATQATTLKTLAATL